MGKNTDNISNKKQSGKIKIKDKYRIYLLPIGNRIKLIGSSLVGLMLACYLSRINVMTTLVNILIIITAIYFCYTVYISFNYYIYLDFQGKVLIIKDFFKNKKDKYDLSIAKLKEIKFSNGYGNLKKSNYSIIFVFDSFEIKVDNWSFASKNIFIGKVDYHNQRNRLSMFTMKTNLRLYEENKLKLHN